MKTLDELAIEFGTDKSSAAHDYARTYDGLFRHLRDAPIRLLEIGVKTGASIRMWEEYFPHASITAVDLSMRKARHKLLRARVHLGDASNPEFLTKVYQERGPFDIVIDDSSHTIPVAQAIVDVLWPNWIKPGGCLVIEDVHSGYKRDLPPEKRHDFVHWAKDMVLAVNHHGNLIKAGPAFWDRSTEFDKAIASVTYTPGLMIMRRR